MDTMQRIVSTQIARYPHTYIHAWYLVENKEVPDRNIGVPPLRKYAIYLRAEIIVWWYNIYYVR
jgi:hypothetical protein